jgi:hypothetical protein
MARCGLYQGGNDLPDANMLMNDAGSADVAADLNVEDRGMMVDDSGTSCTCVPPDAENDGWTYVGGQPNKGTCPMEWTDAPQSVLWDPQASGYGCTCACAQTLPTCSAKDLTFEYGPWSCGWTTRTCNGSFPANMCASCDQGWLNDDVIEINNKTIHVHNEQTVRIKSGLVQSGGSCSPQTTPVKGTITTKDAQLCGFSGTKLTCMNGDPCLPQPMAPYAMCVMKPESSPITACPNGFPKGIDGMSAGPTHVGTATDDTGIVCPSCACNGAPGSCNFSVDVFADEKCTQNKLLFNATATCQSDGQGTNGFHPQGLMLKATPKINCAPVNPSPAPTGMPKLTGKLMAVCCR